MTVLIRNGVDDLSHSDRKSGWADIVEIQVYRELKVVNFNTEENLLQAWDKKKKKKCNAGVQP